MGLNRKPLHRSLFISFKRSDLNCVPWSDQISFGIPTPENMSIRFSETLTVSILRRGIASGKQLERSIKIKIYLWPFSDGDNGPTRRMATRKNGSFITGMDTNDTFLAFPLGKDLWHVGHEQQKRSTVASTSGQKNVSTLFSGVLRYGKCPASGSYAVDKISCLILRGTTNCFKPISFSFLFWMQFR